MNVKLPYSRGTLSIDLPDNVDVITARDISGVPNEAEALRAAMRQPIDSAPLMQKVKPGDKVVIVHTDITRATPNDRILPVLLAELEQAGIAREDITLLNALGTHRPQTESELRQMLGDGIVDNYRCIQHNGKDDANLVSFGTTSRGHPVRINRLLAEADVKILTGFIEPHLFAGFSGGPKGILPSVAGADSVQTNHGFDMIGHPNATWGITEGNPIWEEMREVALRVNPTFLLNVTMNTRREITAVFAGDMMAAHNAGCNFLRENSMVGIDEPYDVAITTNGGYPLDQNLYQAIKGISAVNRIVRDGGTIIMAGACQDGVPYHGGYANILKQAGSPKGALELLARPNFQAQDQWTVQIQAMIQTRVNVCVYSDGLTDAEIRDCLYTPCRNIEKTLAELTAHYGTNSRVCVVADGPQTISYVRQYA